MVGGGLGGNSDAFFFGAADKLDGAFGGGVGDMYPAARQLRQSQVAGNDNVLGGVGYAAKPQLGRYHTLVHLPALGENRVLAVVGNG